MLSQQVVEHGSQLYMTWQLGSYLFLTTHFPAPHALMNLHSGTLEIEKPSQVFCNNLIIFSKTTSKEHDSDKQHVHNLASGTSTHYPNYIMGLYPKSNLFPL